MRLRETVNRNKPPLQFDIGELNLADAFPQIPEPEYTIEDRQVVDRTRQKTVGVGKTQFGIGGRLELRADLQKTDYLKTRTALDGTETSGWPLEALALTALRPCLALRRS